MIKDERLKQLMEQVGLPHSQILYEAFKQLEREVRIEEQLRVDKAIKLLKDCKDMCMREDSDGDILNSRLGTKIRVFISENKSWKD